MRNSTITKKQNIELVRIDLDDSCVRMRIDVPISLENKIRTAFEGRIKYNVITLKDVYLFLIRLGIEVYEDNPNGIERHIPVLNEMESGSNMHIPKEVSQRLDCIKGELSINKKRAFLSLLRAGLVRYQNQVNKNDLQVA